MSNPEMNTAWQERAQTILKARQDAKKSNQEFREEWDKEEKADIEERKEKWAVHFVCEDPYLFNRVKKYLEDRWFWTYPYLDIFENRDIHTMRVRDDDVKWNRLSDAEKEIIKLFLPDYFKY